MAATTGIEWADHTASPWHGCAHATYTDADGNEHAHQGCLNCYAEKNSKRNPGTLGVWGKNGTRVMSASFHENCRRWNRQAEKAGKRASVFPSIMDPFEDWQGPILNAKGERYHYYEPRRGYFTTPAYYCEQPGSRFATMSDLRRDLFATIDACPWLDFLLLTKRPQNVRGMWPPSVPPQDDLYNVFASFQNSIPASRRAGMSYFRPNVHLLTSISTQADAEALTHLLKCRDLVPVLGVSAEPLLDLLDCLLGETCAKESGCLVEDEGPSLDWVVVGGESGANARPCDLAWIRSIRDQCKEAGVACYIKQLGARSYDSSLYDEESADNVSAEDDSGCQLNLRDAKGGDPSEWPEDLRVRQMPLKGSVK